MVFFLFPELTLCCARARAHGFACETGLWHRHGTGRWGFVLGVSLGGRWGEAALGLARARMVQGEPGEASRSHPADFSLFSYFFFPPGRTKPYRT